MAKKVEVRGVKNLSKKLKKLGAAVDGEKLEMAAVAGGLILQNGMKQRAPRLTSTLRRSIHIGGHENEAPDFSSSAEGRGPQRVSKPERKKGRVKIFVGTDLVYAAIQEYGGEIRPKKAAFLRFQVDGEWVMARRVRIPAQPYVRPTFEADAPEAKREVGEALRDLIRAAIKR